MVLPYWVFSANNITVKQFSSNLAKYWVTKWVQKVQFTKIYSVKWPSWKAELPVNLEKSKNLWEKPREWKKTNPGNMNIFQFLPFERSNFGYFSSRNKNVHKKKCISWLVICYDWCIKSDMTRFLVKHKYLCEKLATNYVWKQMYFYIKMCTFALR